MPFNRPPPEQRSRRPDRFYSVDQANAYHSEANADIQRDLTRMALSLLPHSNNPLLLDLGCGSGLSTQHLPPLSIGVDVSASMLKLAAKDVDHGYICAAAFALPFRNDSFDHCISISMLQWLSLQQLHQFFRELARILKPTGTAVLQVYPLDLPHADEMVQAARKETGKPVVLVADFPHSNSALKWFLCVDSTADEKSHDKCPLARRMDRACAYNYRKQRGLQQGRLGLEHVLYAWHAFRKIMRARQLSTMVQRHHKERQIFPNEERLVNRLVEILGQTISREQLIQESDLVVDIMHQTFP